MWEGVVCGVWVRSGWVGVEGVRVDAGVCVVLCVRVERVDRLLFEGVASAVRDVCDVFSSSSSAVGVFLICRVECGVSGCVDASLSGDDVGS